MKDRQFSQRFGERLRVLRVARGMSQEDLAAAAGLHRTHISLIERNKRSARLETVERLAMALGVQPSELIPDLSNSPGKGDQPASS